MPNALKNTETTGISAPLSEHINLVGDLLGRAISQQAGTESLELVEELRGLCKKAIAENDPAYRQEALARIGTLSLDEIVWLLRSFTSFFHLVNQAEQQEIIRINRDRSRVATAENPRNESISEAISTLRKEGVSFEDVLSFINALDIQPTITAHPTEARRRSILYKQQRIAKLIVRLRRDEPTPHEEADILNEIYNQILLLLATDEIRAERPSVLEEVENGLFFVRNSIWATIPRIHKDVKRAVKEHYGEDINVPSFLKFRSWIGSDRDGNPKVTAEVTRQTLRLQRRTAASLYLTEFRELRRELSISERQIDIPTILHESIGRDEQDFQLTEFELRQFRHEPYRQKITFMMKRLDQQIELLDNPAMTGKDSVAYSGPALRADLKVLIDALAKSGLDDIVENGRLGNLMIQAEAFGMHLNSLDIRQHSEIHEHAVAELLALSGVDADYMNMPEDTRIDVLTNELMNPRPLLPFAAELTPITENVVSTFDVVSELISVDPDVMGSFIVSMTHDISDLLEVLILAKEVGLWRIDGGVVTTDLDVVPLFETIEDLQDADSFLDVMFSHPIFVAQLIARNNLQEIMLGYSDSNKDGGYLMANWALHRAQERIGSICRKHKVDCRLFHGRGGTVGRGGGRAGQAILAMPRVTHNGKIRFTEQGEVISFRYAFPDIAHRHLEQITNATILAPFVSHPSVANKSEEARLLDNIADLSMNAYRKLVDDPEMWGWYVAVTPIAQISSLPIASRPISRKSADEVDFDGLRAIPWVFAWTQTRYAVPGWYGLGAAFAAIENNPDDLVLMKRLYQEWPFFSAIIKNAELEMGRARLDISAEYATHFSPETGSFHDTIKEDYDRATNAILSITGESEILDHARVIKKSIRIRNSYTDVLNLLQIELLDRRLKQTDNKNQFDHALLLSVNGIAAAMQSTG